jgi:hypothetical protein
MSKPASPTSSGEAGYRRPPAATRFKKGQSGNPKGRPRARHRTTPFDSVLGQMVTIREGGRERSVTAAEAFILRLTQKGLAGDNAAARASLEAIEAARLKRPEHEQRIRSIRIVMVGTGIDAVIGESGIAFKRNRKDQENVRWEIEPWVVEAALARMAPKQLTEAEQQEVWQNTRNADCVHWPDWWTVKA